MVRVARRFNEIFPYLLGYARFGWRKILKSLEIKEKRWLKWLNQSSGQFLNGRGVTKSSLISRGSI